MWQSTTDCKKIVAFISYEIHIISIARSIAKCKKPFYLVSGIARLVPLDRNYSNI